MGRENNQFLTKMVVGVKKLLAGKQKIGAVCALKLKR
jgi:hypothetical protein